MWLYTLSTFFVLFVLFAHYCGHTLQNCANDCGMSARSGRHHQIRAQLSAIGSPIKGDLKYGFDRSNPDGGIHLHARKLVFTHPFTKENMEILAPTPDDVIWNAI